MHFIDIDKEINKQALELEQYVIRTRRVLHSYAEVSGTETQTHSYIANELESLGLPYETVGNTGIIATLDTGRPGPSIALRADIDALPIPENPNNLKGPRVCVSQQPDTCHACGHDAHTAMLLGSIQLLCNMQDELRGTVYCCFEEGEENGKGAPKMMEALSHRHIDTVWAIHVYSGLDSGKINVSPGPRMSGTVGVEIMVNGRGGHGSRPDLSINPVFCAAAIVANIPGAFVNQLNPAKPVTDGITTIQGGGASNVFDNTASILGTLRYFDAAEGRKALDIVKSVASHTAAMHRCSVEFGPRMKILGVPPVNDEECAAMAESALAQALPEGTVCDCDPWYASESFSRYLKQYPGVLAFLGIRNPEIGTGAAHHSEFFDVDEQVMKIGVISTVKYALAAMNNEKLFKA